VIQDVTAKRAMHETLWRSAHFDDLTSLPNRSYFGKTLARKIGEAALASKPLALLCLDLDGFKEINDTRGHLAGDAVLREVAGRLKDFEGPDVFIARLGGDEFAIVIDGFRSDRDVSAAAEKLLRQIRRPIDISGEKLHISASIGVSVYPRDATTSDDLLKTSDIALYRAKQLGRGAMTSFAPEIAGLFDGRRIAIDHVRKALAGNRVVPFYQPKVNFSTGRIEGFEALIRIRGKDGSIYGPTDFWPAFQNTDIARRIGDRMLQLVTADIARWRDKGLDPGCVGINVMEADFASGSLADRILKRLDDLSLPTSALKIEVTETVFLGEDARVVDIALLALSDAGVRIALDDFGTGYASLTHLKNYPIDCIKIDRSFIDGLTSISENALIVRAVIELGHSLRLAIVAEGVETNEQALLLKGMGCDLGQGYLFGRPSPAQETEALLDTIRAGGRPDGHKASASFSVA
jgi:diguanylate cyclase (GGDEF)-like protein